MNICDFFAPLFNFGRDQSINAPSGADMMGPRKHGQKATKTGSKYRDLKNDSHEESIEMTSTSHNDIDEEAKESETSRIMQDDKEN